MHIQPGILAAQKIAYANVMAWSTLASFAPALLKTPPLLVKTLAAAGFFSVLMEIFHLPVGPSELHLVGASAVYFLFGFLPTLFGFALGLAIQGLVFEPQDLLHLGVNSLSLILPLIAAHGAIGRQFFAKGAKRQALRWSEIVKFDAIYYSGVVGMVGFWLLNGSEATPLASWGVFAISYLPLILVEPVFTWAALKFAQKADPGSVLAQVTVAQQLKLAA
jgi:ABC-type Co2+ transport system permease subunit